MTISFNEVPSNLRTPFVYAEFDNSNAIQGPSLQPYKILMMGSKLAAGTKAALSLNLVTSAEKASEFFGAGSMLADMADAFLTENKINELYCVPLDDAGAGVQAAGEILFSGAPTKAGTLRVYIAGKRAEIAVSAGQSLASIVTDLAAVITADTSYLVTAAANGGTPEQIDFVAKNDGEPGNDIDIRFNYFDGDETPAGLIHVVTAMVGGSGNPDLSTVFAVLDETQYLLMVSPFIDTANISAVEAELALRFGPLKQNDGYCFYGAKGSLSELNAIGDARNSQFSVINRASGPSHPYRFASGICGEVARAASIDPARPFQTLVLSSVLAESDTEKLTLEERNILLHHGIATSKVSDGGSVVIERIITTYKKNAAGADDVSYLDLNTLLTLSYLRYDFRNTFLRKYPRHKLANDGTRYGSGQAIMTPKVAKGEAINIFKAWELLGLVEGVDQFKNDLIIERSVTDVNRLDILLPPDLVNQLRVVGVKIGFLL